MVLVLALFLTALCGVHSASIPSNSLGIKLASKSANMLDKRDSPSLEKIRRSVLEDMKRLLDTQLAALFESAVKQKAGAQSKRSKLKTKLHPTINMGDTAPLESVTPDKNHDSNFIKVLTDGSLQDPADEVLRNAVDKLLQEDEDKTADNIEKGGEVLYSSNEDQLIRDNSTRNNSEEIINEDAFDDAPLPLININDKDRQKDESNNRRGISHVIIEHVPKTDKKFDENEKSDNILDLDEIIKSAVKDLSGSLEDERSKSIDLGDTDSFTHNIYPESSQQNEPRISNYSQSKTRIHDSDNNNSQVDRLKNVSIDETEQSGNSEENEKSDNRALETRTNSVIEPENLKTQHHKHSNKYGKNHRDRQTIKQSHSAENNRNNRHDVQRAGKHVNEDGSDIKDLRNRENDDELRKYHNERQHSNEKSKEQHENNGNHSNLKQHSKYLHNKNHDKHKHHNDNEKHDRSANKHIIVRLMSDSDASNESSLDNMSDKKPIHKKAIHIISSDLSKRRHQDSKETSNHSHSYNLFVSRENAVNEVKVSHDDSNDENNLTEIQKLSINKKKNSIEENEHNSEEEDYLIESRNDTKKESNFRDYEKPVARDGDKNLLFADEGNDNENENDATKEMENKAKGTGDIQAKTKIRDMEENSSEENKAVTKNYKKSKKHETHCHHERNEQMDIESDQLNVIRDLMQNKEMKKSYTLSLTLSTK